jgi:hypothetical protein
MATGNRSLTLKLLADISDFNKNLDKGAKDVDGFGDKMAAVGKKVGVALAAAAAAAGAMAIKIGIDGVKAASNLAETQSKVNVIFGESSAAITKFASTAATQLGQTREQAMNAAATFATFGKSAGLAGNDLVKFSTELTTLSADLASFYNTSPEQAINAIGAALRGESEPIRAYGVLLNDATLKQEAMNMGIYDGTGALSAQQKVLAAQQVILKQTGDAQGDFARTSGGLANQQRILTAQIENTKAMLGEALLPTVLSVVAFINNNVIPTFEAFVYGLTGNKGAVEGLDETQKSAYYAGEAFRSVAQSIAQLAAAFSTDGKSSMEGFITVLKFVAQTANVVVTIIKELISFIIEMANQVIGFLNLFGAGIQKIKSIQGTAFSAWGDPTAAGGSIYGSNPNLMGGGGGAGGSAGGGAGGSGGFSGGSGSGSGAGTGGGGGTGASAGITGATSLNNLVKRLTGISDQFTELQFLVDTGGISKKAGLAELNKLTKEFNVLEAQANALTAQSSTGRGVTDAASRSGQAYAAGINITVNGAIDSESTARQIVEILNDSAARGTLGAEKFSNIR